MTLSKELREKAETAANGITGFMTGIEWLLEQWTNVDRYNWTTNPEYKKYRHPEEVGRREWTIMESGALINGTRPSWHDVIGSSPGAPPESEHSVWFRVIEKAAYLELEAKLKVAEEEIKSLNEFIETMDT